MKQAGIPWLARMGEPPRDPRPSVTYDIPLQPDGRRDNWMRLVLPQDLSQTEAERICGIIRAVAMPPDREDR